MLISFLLLERRWLILSSSPRHSGGACGLRFNGWQGTNLALQQGHSLGTITVSTRVAALPHHGTSVNDLLVAADSALDRAKREGRNRVATPEVSADTDSAPLIAKP